MCSLTTSCQTALAKKPYFQVDKYAKSQASAISSPINQPIINPNPWKSQELQELGWSKFMRKKSEEALLPVNVKNNFYPTQRSPLARTSSAPVPIPKRVRRPQSKGFDKEKLVRVRSAGESKLSPGGTRRITYDRQFLLECRQSPLSLTPPSGLPVIPGATVPRQQKTRRVLEKSDSTISTTSVASASSSTSTITDNETLKECEPA